MGIKRKQLNMRQSHRGSREEQKEEEKEEEGLCDPEGFGSTSLGPINYHPWRG